MKSEKNTFYDGLWATVTNCTGCYRSMLWIITNYYMLRHLYSCVTHLSRPLTVAPLKSHFFFILSRYFAITVLLPSPLIAIWLSYKSAFTNPNLLGVFVLQVLSTSLATLIPEQNRIFSEQLKKTIWGCWYHFDSRSSWDIQIFAICNISWFVFLMTKSWRQSQF